MMMTAKVTPVEPGRVVSLPGRPFGDAELVEGLAAGRAAAAAELHRRFGPRIDRWVWRLLGADSEHEDVVQQVYVNVLTGIGGLKRSSALAGWIDSVTIRTVHKELRRRRIRRLVTFSSPTIELAVAGRPGDLEAWVPRFYAVCERMRAEDRIVFVLRHVEGLPLEETARAAACSLATAKRRLVRAHEVFLQEAPRDPLLARLIEDLRHAE